MTYFTFHKPTDSDVLYAQGAMIDSGGLDLFILGDTTGPEVHLSFDQSDRYELALAIIGEGEEAPTFDKDTVDFYNSEYDLAERVNSFSDEDLEYMAWTALAALKLRACKGASN